MKKTLVRFMLMLTGICLIISLAGCGEEEKNQNELVLGNWTQLRNRAYILLILNPKGEWQSTVRITDVTSKIVKSKGNATGTWQIEENQMIFTVGDSDIEDIWEKNATLFFEIVELTETLMHLKDSSGYVAIWKQAGRQTAEQNLEPVDPMISVGPVAVNLNKNRSNDKDRYLCLNMNIVLNELLPGEAPPPLHPRAREAAMIFLSSLVFGDVKDFDKIKAQNKKLIKVMNPYMDGVIKDIEIEHVIVATEIDKVEEFMIEHTLVEEPAVGEGEEGENGSAKKGST